MPIDRRRFILTTGLSVAGTALAKDASNRPLDQRAPA